MVEKPSRLLTTAKELISSQKLHDAMIICEDVIKVDPNNINGLLLATKCWMDLDIKPDNIKNALEKVLLLKPNNPSAIQGLRKFYEKNLDIYFDDAVKFFKNLFQTNELTDKDFDLITKTMVKNEMVKETEKFVWDCLLYQINKHKDISCLKKLFQIASENFLINYNNKNDFDQFVALLAQFDSKNMSCDGDEVDYLKSMETLFKAFIDKMEPEYFFTLLSKNDSSVYGYILFADLLCSHYLFDDCKEAIDIGLTKLQSDTLMRPKAIQHALKIIQINNLIHLSNVDQLQSNWPANAVEFMPKYFWCQSYAVGFDAFAYSGCVWADVSDDWCLDMPPHIVIICRYLMEGPTSSRSIDEDHNIIIQADLSSFELYLWSRVMKKSKLLDKQRESLEVGLRHQHVYYKIHADLAREFISENDNKSAVTQLWLALEKHFCPNVLECLVDLHMLLQQYAEPVEIFEKLEIERCTESLIEKFALCLDKMERLSNAISTAQRLVKYFPKNGKNWQLLGDLYLKRMNINCAFTTYSRSIEMSGESSGIFARMGNVYSLKYQQTFNENDFAESVNLFQKSLELCPSSEAVEGKACVHYLHAEMSLKQLMLSCAINDVQTVLDLLIKYDYLIKDNEFELNLMGKAVFLSILGNIDNLINFNSISQFLSLSLKVVIDPFEIGFRCFKISIQRFPSLSESYFNFGLLCLLKLNKQCANTQRGNIIYPELYKQAEEHFKSALYFDSKNSEAWKYLGYLYFRHGLITSRHVFDVQHCLSTSINISSTVDKLKDPESAFLLGLLYIRENWYYLAKELFLKIQMDHHANPIGYIGMYLLAGKDHEVSEQMQITKAIMCYIYRDEDSNLDDSCYRMNDSVVGLFCDNLGFLVNSQCDYDSFDSQENRSDLISALKTALNHAWIKFEVYNSIGLALSSEKQKQYREYGCFLGMLELLSGNYQLGKQLIKKSNISQEDPNLIKLFDLLKLENSWISYNENNGNFQECVENIEKVAKHINLSICKNTFHESTVQNPYQPTRVIDELILTAIVQYLSSSTNLSTALELIIAKLPSICDKVGLTLSMQTSFVSVATMISLTRKKSLAIQFIEMIDKYFPCLDDTIDSFSRVFARLRVLELSDKDAYKYIHSHCLKQPYDMNRWMNLLEFGLENLDDLKGFTTISDIFQLTNRPWCFTSFDVERYATILQRHSSVLTTAALLHHRHMIMQSMKLYPHLCLEFFRRFIFVK